MQTADPTPAAEYPWGQSKQSKAATFEYLPFVQLVQIADATVA
jgi:hypothetical protein